MRYIYWIFWILLFAVMVLFAVYNLDPTQVHLLSKTTSIELPLFVLLAASFLLGLVVSLLINLVGSIKYRRIHAQLKSEHKKLEKELERLRQVDVAHRMAQTQSRAPEMVSAEEKPATAQQTTPSST